MTPQNATPAPQSQPAPAPTSPTAQQPAPAPQSAPPAPPPAAPAVEKVTLRHPNTHDTVEVNATVAEMVPYMGRGYQQVKK